MKQIVFILLLIFSIAAHAQTDSYDATLKKMLEVSGSEATFQAGIKQMFSMFKQQNANVPEEMWTAMETEFSKTSMNELVEMLTPVYKRHLTESDLKSVIIFFESPAGKKYAEKNPFIMQESMQVGAQWGQKVAQRVMEKLKEKGY